MPSGDDPVQVNIGVIVARINRLEQDYNDLGADVSKAHERLNYIERDKLSRAEFVAWTMDAQKWRELVIAHLERIDSRLGLWAGGNVLVTVIASVIAGIYGRGP